MSDQKLLVLYGAHTGDLINIPHSSYSRKYIERYNVPVTYIGDPKSGFELDALAGAFADHIQDDQVLNVILCMHGDVNEETGEYYLTAKDDVKSSAVIEALVKASNNQPLKILAISCHGANLQKDLGLLPVGSCIMTLSNPELKTLSDDSSGPIAALLPEFFKDHGFKLEHLFESCILTQRFSSNVPQIGVRNLDGSVNIVKVIDMVPAILSDQPNSPFIQYLVDRDVLSADQLNIARAKAKEYHDNPAELLCPNLIDQVVEHWKNGTLEQFIAECEQRYYFPGTLTARKHLLQPFSDSIETTTTADNYMSKTLYAYYMVKYEHIDQDPLVKEREELLYSDHASMTDAQKQRLNEVLYLPICERWGMYKAGLSTDRYTEFQLADIFYQYSKVVFADTPGVEYTPANYIPSVSSVCMGLAFDQCIDLLGS